MSNFRLDFIIHWLWTVTFAIMVATGLTLLGPRFGWITNYNMALADYLHRTIAVFFTFLTLVAIVLEIARLLKKEPKKQPWLIFNKSGFGLLNFIVANVLIITGILLWLCTEYEHSITAFAAVVHEMATFVMIFSILWHIYMGSHVLFLELGGKRKNGKK